MYFDAKKFLSSPALCVGYRVSGRSRQSAPNPGPHSGPPSLLLVAYNTERRDLDPESATGDGSPLSSVSLRDSERVRDGGRDEFDSGEIRMGAASASGPSREGRILIFRSIRAPESKREKERDTVRLNSSSFYSHLHLDQIAAFTTGTRKCFQRDRAVGLGSSLSPTFITAFTSTFTPFTSTSLSSSSFLIFLEFLLFLSSTHYR